MSGGFLNVENQNVFDTNLVSICGLCEFAKLDIDNCMSIVMHSASQIPWYLGGFWHKSYYV
jgi:hypothetical protein